MTPYVVSPVEPGMAHVLDRATGQQVGYVIALFVGWGAYCSNAPGLPVVPERRYRREAAEAVWDHFRLIHRNDRFSERADLSSKVAS